MKTTRAILILLSSTLLISSYANAADFRTGDLVEIGADDIINDDLYIAATKVVVDGLVKGDLIVVGSTVRIRGHVEGSVLGAASSLWIEGCVGTLLPRCGDVGYGELVRSIAGSALETLSRACLTISCKDRLGPRRDMAG